MPYRLAFLALCCLACIQCGGARTPTPSISDGHTAPTLVDGEATAQRLVNTFKQAHNVIFSMYMVYDPAPDPANPGNKKPHLSFSLTAWAPADGRIRIRLTKLGVDFLEALIDSDGNFTGVLVRDKKIVTGNLDDLMPQIEKVITEQAAAQTTEQITEQAPEQTAEPATSTPQNAPTHRAGAPLFAALDLLRNEVKHGPVTIADSYQLDRTTQTLHIPLPESLSAQLLLGSKKSAPVLRKSIFSSNGTRAMTLVYSKYADMDGLYRAKKMRLLIPNDQSTYLFRLKKVDVITRISSKSMLLDIPDYPHIPIEEFAQKVAE